MFKFLFINSLLKSF